MSEQNPQAKIIAQINQTNILSFTGSLVAVKPICEAIGIDFSSQVQKIKSHPILGSVVVMNTTTGSDEKQYEMFCIPLDFVFGWLFTIDSRKVKPEAKDAVLKYQLECYKALLHHFAKPQKFLQDKNTAIEKELSYYEEVSIAFKTAKNNMTDAKARLKSVRQLSMEDWEMNNQQLSLDFTPGQPTANQDENYV